MRSFPRAASISAALIAMIVPLTVSGPASADPVGDPQGSSEVLMPRAQSGAAFTVRGRGWGHGHGMSQYGALGAAREGLGHRRILRFYYPRTSVDRAGGRIRVLLTEATGRSLTVRAAPGVKVRPEGGEAVVLPQRRTTAWRLVSGGPGTRVQFRRDGGWRTWRSYRTGTVQLEPGRAPLRLVGHGRYRGVLRSVPVRAGAQRREVINVVRLESYVRGVVPLEIPASWDAPAVRAQSVAARTYAVRERADRRRSAWHLCDTTSCQVYGGVAAEHPAADRAIRHTRGQVLTYRGRPAFTQFSASNGGWTASGGLPYLPAKRDPYDGLTSPYSTWRAGLTQEALAAHWPGIGRVRAIRTPRRDGNGPWGGRVLTVRLIGSEGSVRVSGEDFRYLLGLRSTLFRIS